MKLRNKLTGQIIEVLDTAKGDMWEAVADTPPAPKKPKSAKKKAEEK